MENFVTKLKKRLTKSGPSKKECQHQLHPDHKKESVRLMRVNGQITGIIKMIEDCKYCPDILIQVRAAKAALQAVEQSILKTHLNRCVSEAIHSKDENKAREKVSELIQLIERHK